MRPEQRRKRHEDAQGAYEVGRHVAGFRREIIEPRIWRAHQERSSQRACHLAAYISSASCGRMRQKIPARASSTSVHMRTPQAEDPEHSRAAAGNEIDDGLSACSQSTMALLDALRRADRCSRSSSKLHRPAARASARKALANSSESRDAEAQHRRDHGRAGAVRHQLRSPDPDLRMRLEGAMIMPTTVPIRPSSGPAGDLPGAGTPGSGLSAASVVQHAPEMRNSATSASSRCAQDRLKAARSTRPSGLSAVGLVEVLRVAGRP